MPGEEKQQKWLVEACSKALSMMFHLKEIRRIHWGYQKNIFTEAATCKTPRSTPIVRYDIC